jgi:glycosyltransferase involved in cell wall biosynthesis
MRIILDLQACQASSMQRGIGRYSMALALAMARNSGAHDLRIALNEGFPDSVPTLRQAFGGLLPPAHISTYATPSPAAEVDPANGWRIAAAERIRERYLASLCPDIVHVASLFEGLSDNSVVSVPQADGRFDTAVTLYDLIPLLNGERYLADPNIARWYHRKLDSLKRAGLLLAISGHARQEAIAVLGLAPDTVVNISSAVDDIFRPRTLAPHERSALLERHGIRRAFIMYTGGIDWRKNIEGLIEAYALLPAPTRRQYQLAIVCSIHEPDRVRLQRLAAKCGLAEDDLVLTGFVPDDDLVLLYNSTTLFVFPSLHEGFGLPALEAMACGAAVIGSNSSSIPEVIGRADALFDPTNISAISQAMAAVLDDPARRAALQEHGLRQATLFSWDASAKRALEAFEETQRRRIAEAASGSRVSVPPAAPGSRPRLAYVSPLPPERSGIAGYSAELLPELAHHYDIDLVLAPERGETPYAPGGHPQRSLAWFEEHAHEFDHIVYQFGNSTFHTHMFGLLERHPGVVVLHDFFLSGVLSHTEITHTLPNNYARMLYQSHGYAALALERQQGRFPSVNAYPCNRPVLDRATGVIVHSNHAAALAAHWYGLRLAARLRVLPLLRTPPDNEDRGAARRALGIGEDAFLVCSFGIVSAPKCNDRIVEAWLNSALADDLRCSLVFVGEAGNDRFGFALRERIAAHPRIGITGYVDDAQYRHYLAAADAAIQLRSGSRGETSAGVLDCLAAGLPTIVNAHGSAAEVPPDACVRIEDAFSDAALRDAIETLLRDAALRTGLGARAGAYMRAHHAPAHVGALYREAIEGFARDSDGAAETRLIGEIAAIGGEPAPSDLLQVAAAVAANRPCYGPAQWLVDVTVLASTPRDGATAARCEGLRSLLLAPPADCRVEPVRYDGTRYRYARKFALGLIERDDLAIEDAVADAGAGDVLLSFEGETAHLPPVWRARGVSMRALEDAAAA